MVFILGGSQMKYSSKAILVDLGENYGKVKERPGA
jgi:hypothetical protein